MNLRTKILLVFIALALAPLAAASIVSYRGAASAVEAALRERADGRVALAAGTVEGALKRHERALLVLAESEPLKELVSRAAAAEGASPLEVPEGVRSALGSFLAGGGGQLESVVLIGGPDRSPLARAASKADGVAFQTSYISGVRYDGTVWGSARPAVLRSQVTPEAEGPVVRLAAPVFVGEGGGPAGALALEVKARALLAEAEAARSPAVAGGAARAGAGQELFAVENSTGLLVYHTNSALNHQPVASAMPSCAPAAERMRAGESGSAFYEEPGAGRRLVSYGQAPGLNLSLAAAEDYTAALAPARGAALWAGGLSALAGLAGLALLIFFARRAERDFSRVAHGASAIAGGQLDRRIEVSTSGETRELAETLNAMGARLREMIAREAESRQFESFVRISAMISHDLKNAIAGLSMLVSNMERQFHREEFRADAIESLREATDKLKRTVARLSEPVRSLSGEYRREARPTDLVPVIRRVLAAHAEPARPLYEIEARLPESLVATVEAERVEAVVENLVVNALEAMGGKGGGRLTVEAGQEGDYVHLSVADTGVGMAEEFIRARLFHPFATTKTKGIGLGLFTCKEVVEAHGGRLEVESRLGVGTRFRVVLPSRLFKSGDRQQRPAKGAG